MTATVVATQRMRLSTFIRTDTEQILVEWETFARSLPMGGEMDIAALRDHAKEMLEVIARDLDTPQTSGEQHSKASGESDAEGHHNQTAAQQHGADRAATGFSISQMVAEFRALRASVIRLWTARHRDSAATDLDDMTRFNEAIDQAIAESITRYADDLGQSKERFLAILGHDLQSPLGAIMTSSKFMLEVGDLAEPNLTLVQRIASSSSRMSQMVKDLLDYTRTRFGDSVPIVREDVDLRKLLHEVVAEVATSHPEHTLQIEATGNLRGQWDGDRMGQVLTNLIANAAQHGTGSSPIRVVAKGDAKRVAISVQNHGLTIPKAQLSNIFQAMKSVNGNGARDSRHLGLGLYIVEKIVAAHEGTVTVASSNADGTTFTVNLPRH